MAFFDTTWYVNFGDGATTGYYAVPVWPGALAAVTAGTWCRQLAAPTVGNERCFVCVAAGTTGASEPVWVVTRGADSAANVDGTVKWMECTGMAGPCGDLTNAPVWVASRVVTLGEVYYDSISGSLQAATTGGTSKSGAAPSFSATAGVTTADNTVTWTSLGPTSNYTTPFKYPHARQANAFVATWGAAGNQFALASNSAETQSSAMTLSPPGTAALPCNIYCISSSTTLAAPTNATTATVSTTGASNITFGTGGGTSIAFWNGVVFQAGSAANSASINLGGTNSGTNVGYYENCGFVLNNTNAASRININTSFNQPVDYLTELTNCTYVFGAAGQGMILGGGYIKMKAGSYAATGTAPTTLFSFANSVYGKNYIQDADLSSITGNLFNVANASSSLVAQNCKLAGGVSVTTGAFSSQSGTYVYLHNCDSAATNYRYYFSNYMATIQQETTIVRTDGATDGVTPLSWNITSTANAKFLQPFLSEEISQWNDVTGSAKTATLYLTSNSALNNNDVWIEFEYLGSSLTPLGTIISTRMALLGTAAPLTSNSSIWGGAITNKYSISSTFTPQMKGPVKARIYVAKATATVYVDPLMVIV